MRFFLLDRVTELVPGQRARGVKAVSLADEALHDHFPGYPVWPGTLLLEGAAQLAGFLLEQSENRDPGRAPRRAVLAQIEEAKFHAPAVPGDLLELEAVLLSALEAGGRVQVEARRAGRKLLRAVLTFSLQEVAVEAVHEQRRRLYELWTRDLDPRPACR